MVGGLCLLHAKGPEPDRGRSTSFSTSPHQTLPPSNHRWVSLRAARSLHSLPRCWHALLAFCPFTFRFTVPQPKFLIHLSGVRAGAPVWQTTTIKSSRRAVEHQCLAGKPGRVQRIHVHTWPLAKCCLFGGGWPPELRWAPMCKTGVEMKPA
jgi:hypothetical protein